MNQVCVEYLQWNSSLECRRFCKMWCNIGVHSTPIFKRERGNQFPTLGVEAVKLLHLVNFVHISSKLAEKSFSIKSHTNFRMIISVASSSLEHPLIDLDPLQLQLELIHHCQLGLLPQVNVQQFDRLCLTLCTEKKYCSIIVVSCIHNTKAGQQHTLEKYITPFQNSGLQ